MNNYGVCDIGVVNERQASELSEETLNKITTMTHSMGQLPVGTFKYKVFKYPGDIDLFENIENCCYYNYTKIKASETIKKIVKDVVQSGDFIYMDFKAGYDKRFNINMGLIEDGKIEDYYPELIKRDVDNLYGAKLLDEDERVEILNMVKSNPTIDEFVKLGDRLREYWLMRWESKEILQGFKVLRGGYKLYLDEAISDNSIVKLDTIAPLSYGLSEYDIRRYVEITNFFYITNKDRFGKISVLTEEFGNYEQSILSDIYKYKDNKIYKSVKRLWMYLNLKGKICELNKFTDLFSSDIALISQIGSDIEVALDLLRSDKNYNKRFLISSISERLTMMNNICNVGANVYVMNNLNLLNNENYDIITILNNILVCIDEYVNDMTNKWLDMNNINIFEMIRD